MSASSPITSRLFAGRRGHCCRRPLSPVDAARGRRHRKTNRVGNGAPGEIEATVKLRCAQRRVRGQVVEKELQPASIPLLIGIEEDRDVPQLCELVSVEEQPVEHEHCVRSHVSDGVCGLDDDFVVPRRMLHLSDDFYASLGRVPALGALVELRLSNVIVLWGNDARDEGQPIHHLSKGFKRIRTARIEAGYEFPAGLTDAVAAGTDAMAERNDLLHSMWPAETSGWRNRPGGTATTRW